MSAPPAADPEAGAANCSPFLLHVESVVLHDAPPGVLFGDVERGGLIFLAWYRSRQHYRIARHVNVDVLRGKALGIVQGILHVGLNLFWRSFVRLRRGCSCSIGIRLCAGAGGIAHCLAPGRVVCSSIAGGGIRGVVLGVLLRLGCAELFGHFLQRPECRAGGGTLPVRMVRKGTNLP